MVLPDKKRVEVISAGFGNKQLLIMREQVVHSKRLYTVVSTGSSIRYLFPQKSKCPSDCWGDLAPLRSNNYGACYRTVCTYPRFPIQGAVVSHFCALATEL